mmetsp:Transcript_13450/g.28229  ORF Transcript_13450/g.28229 Transcript_13450/m.28229 type:complete len:91 (+) Transcript_13450:416-688(+)
MVSFCQLVYFSLGVTCYVTTRSKVFQLHFWMFFSNAIKYEFTASTKIMHHTLLMLHRPFKRITQKSILLRCNNKSYDKPFQRIRFGEKSA